MGRSKQIPTKLVRKPGQVAEKSPRNFSISSKSRKSEVKGPLGRNRVNPGVKALSDIKKYQRTTDNLIPKTSFKNLTKEILQTLSADGSNFRIAGGALEALQYAGEKYLTVMFENANLAAIHAKRVTVMPKDMHLVKAITNNR